MYGHWVHMTIKYSSEFLKKFKKLNSHDQGLREKVTKKLDTFKQDQNYPSLRLHKVSTSISEAWSLSLDRKLRILFVYREYGILLVDIGSHDEVY